MPGVKMGARARLPGGAWHWGTELQPVSAQSTLPSQSSSLAFEQFSAGGGPQSAGHEQALSPVAQLPFPQVSHAGVVEQSASAQSTLPSQSSSCPPVQASSDPGAGPQSLTHEHALSAAPQSPLPQTSQAALGVQSGSAQSMLPSQSSSCPPVHE